MYETYFNLKERPFASVPRIDHYFPAASIEAARVALARCIERAEGTAIAIGGTGTGKTLLCQLLAQQFRKSLQVALLPSGHLSSRRALLQGILYELGQSYRGMDEGELRLSLVDYITLCEDCGRGILLLVDEAHDLPLRLLDEVRMLTNLVRAGQPAVRLILVGNRGLEERFASPKLESFSQRLAARCYLETLQRAETQAYIHARIEASGGRASQIFPVETCQSVYKATDGIPRLINQVCDHVMLLAYVAQRRQIEPAHVEEAWADLQQLPTPWNEPQVDESKQAVIEFGGLEDEPAADVDSSDVLLHITPEIGLAPATDPDPAAQIHQIQEILSDVEEEFKPAGSIRPEIELVFDEPANPFGEPFVEEEVISDRYAPAAAAPCAPAANSHAPTLGKGTVPFSSDENRDSPPTPNAPAATRAPVSVPAAPSAPAVAAKPVERPAAPVQPAAVASYEPPPREKDELVEQELLAETVPMQRESGAPPRGRDDSDMIIIEEGYEDMPSWPARNVVPVRQQEYGRLFAKLRQSS